MTYFKIYDDEKVIGVGTTRDLRKYQEKHNILLTCDESDAQLIAIDGRYYHDPWMQDFPPCGIEYTDCHVQAVTLEEYEAFYAALKTDKIVKPIIEPDPIFDDEEEDIQEPELTIDELRAMKIREMSLACNQAITSGFSIELKDGAQHNFSLTMQDQMNLLTIQAQILAGAAEVPYHADGEEADMFSTEEMTLIIAAANTHKTYQLAYFNAMKKWLNSLKSIAAISAVKYGVTIPQRYQTALLKKLHPEE